MWYYIYKITCLKGDLEGHYYIGKHKTNNINDNYMGSGRIIKDYYKKYGKIEGVSATKEILEYCSSVEELNKAEETWIGENYKNDTNCLNLKAGGENGFQGGNHSEETKRKIKAYFTDERKKEIGERTRQNLIGRKHSEETRRKQSEGVKDKNKCENSPLSRAVLQIRNGEVINMWVCLREAERVTGIEHSQISKCCRGKRKSAGGYQWKYLQVS